MILRYEAAAGKAAVTELKLRILAEVIPDLEQYAHGDKLHELESRIFQWFAAIGDPVSDEAQTVIKTTRTFRNKLLHGELHTARNKLHQLGAPRRTGGVMHMKFGEGSELDQIVAALQDGTMMPVAAAATDEVGIGGWLLEMGRAGDFESAYALCRQATVLVDSLIDRAQSHYIRLQQAQRDTRHLPP